MQKFDFRGAERESCLNVAPRRFPWAFAGANDVRHEVLIRNNT